MKLAAIVILTAALPITYAAADQCLTQEQGDRILAELQHIRELLDGQPGLRAAVDQAPATVALDLRGTPAIGSENAPVTVVEFTDYQCPFCQRFAADVLPLLQKEYIGTGRVRFVVMNLPLDIHPDAMLAAQAASCASEHGAFWPMHSRLQSHADRLSMGDLLQYADDLGLDRAKFDECLKSAKHKDAIQKAIVMANANGIRGTPTFVIGKSGPNEMEGEVILGGSGAAIEQKLKALLK